MAELPYGKSALSVAVEGDLLAPGPVERVADEAGMVQAALREPIGTSPLRDIARPGERVAIVVNDITRLTRTDLLLPLILDEPNAAGIPDGDIFIVFALGIHRPQTEEERKLIVGEEIFGRIRCFDHDCRDDANLIAVGTTRFGNAVEINRE